MLSTIADRISRDYTDDNTDIIAFKVGWGFLPFTFAHGIRLKYAKRHPGLMNYNEFGVQDIPERVHWDPEFARRIGVPNAYDLGPQRIAWMCQTITNWMGDDGFIEQFSGSCYRFNLIGDTSWCRAKVINKCVKKERYLVQLDLWVADQRNETTAKGKAIVALPSKSGWSPPEYYGNLP